MKKFEIVDLKSSELLKLRAEIEVELNSRGVKFSVGDIGETLAIEYFNTTGGLPTLRDAPVGTKNIDAISRDGERYSIKTIKSGTKTGTVYPDREAPDKQLFEYMLIVMLGRRYELQRIYRLTWQLFTKLRAWDSRMQAWYVPVTRKRMLKAETIHGDCS